MWMPYASRSPRCNLFRAPLWVRPRAGRPRNIIALALIFQSPGVSRRGDLRVHTLLSRVYIGSRERERYIYVYFLLEYIILMHVKSEARGTGNIITGIMYTFVHTYVYLSIYYTYILYARCRNKYV